MQLSLQFHHAGLFALPPSPNHFKLQKTHPKRLLSLSLSDAARGFPCVAFLKHVFIIMSQARICLLPWYIFDMSERKVVVGVIINVFIYRINSYKIVSSRALKSKICYLESVVELEYHKHFFNYKKWSSLLWIRKVPYVYENVFVMTEICRFDVITLDNILQNSETEVLILRYLFISLMRCHVFHMGPQDKCSIGLNLMFKAGNK